MSKTSPCVELIQANTAAELGLISELFIAYKAGLGIDLCFQGFANELQTLPGQYTAPAGSLLLALVDGEPAGCCALRPLLCSDHLNACEMKRLFVLPPFRGLGLGRLLVEQTITQANLVGYNTMLLDTLSDMASARALYQGLGFVTTEPYYRSPLIGAHYLKLSL